MYRAWVLWGWVIGIGMGMGMAGCFPDPDELRALANPGLTGGIGGGEDGAAGRDGPGGIGRDGAAGGSGGRADSGGGGTGGGGTGGMGMAGRGGTGGMMNGTGGMDGGGPSAVEACHAYADTTIGVLARCSPLLLQMLYGTQQVAEQRARLLCKSVELPGVNFPRRPVAPCLEAVRVASCEDFFDSRVPAACQAPGDYPAGSPCSGGDQCASTFCDFNITNAACGQCAALPGPGQACLHAQYCRQGLACSLDGTCAQPSEANGPCSDSQPCRARFLCDGSVCIPRGAPGAFCASREDCDETRGSICNEDVFECIAYQGGPSCGPIRDGVMLCQAAGTCPDGGGACRPAAADGAACNDETGPFCLAPASCLVGICRLPAYNTSCVARPASARDEDAQTGGPLRFLRALLHQPEPRRVRP